MNYLSQQSAEFDFLNVRDIIVIVTVILGTLIFDRLLLQRVNNS